MAAERQIPGGPYVNEVATAQRQIPGRQYINETVSAAPPATPAARILRTAAHLDGCGSDGRFLGNALE